MKNDTEPSQTNMVSDPSTSAIRRRRRLTTVFNSSDAPISKISHGIDRWIKRRNNSSQRKFHGKNSRRLSCRPFWCAYSFGTFLWLSLCLFLHQSGLTWADCTFMDGQCTYNIRLASPGASIGDANAGVCSPAVEKEDRKVSGTQQSQNDYAQQMTNIVKDFDYMKGDHEKRIKELEHYVLKLLSQLNAKSDSNDGNAQVRSKQGSGSESGNSGNEIYNGVSYSNSNDDRLIKTLHKEFTALRNANKEKSHKLRVLGFQLNETRQKLTDTQDALITNTEQLVQAEQTLSVLQDDKYILQNRLKDKSARLFRAEKKLAAVEKRNKEIDEQLLKLIRSENNLKEELHTYKYRLNDTLKLLDELKRKYDLLDQEYTIASQELVLREKELIECVRAKTQSFCGFEDPNMCGFTQANGTDNFDWTHAKGGTPSADTGPDLDHTCKSPEGHFLHLEASAKGRGHTAVVKSPTYKGFTAQCVQFYYHMYGRHMGTLNVYTQLSSHSDIHTAPRQHVDRGNMWTKSSSEAELQSVWRAYGNQGNVWIMARLSIPENLAKEGYHIVFEGSTETGYQGDMAIDDISVQDGECPVDPHLRPVIVPDITTRAPFNRTIIKTKKRRRKKPRGHSRRRHNGTRTSTE